MIADGRGRFHREGSGGHGREPGIGRLIAVGLAKRGAAVVGTARNLDSSPGAGGTLRETFAMIEAAGGKGLAVPGGITDTAGANALIERAKSEFGRVDILVNNAGVHPHESVSRMTDEQWDEMLAVNLSAPFRLTRAVLPTMIEQGSGNILGVSSGAGATSPRAESSGYGATKAALDRMCYNLAAEVEEHGIAVNTWIPGILTTDMNAGRGIGEPVEVAEESVMWLLAQDAESFTGRSVRREDFNMSWGPQAQRV